MCTAPGARQVIGSSPRRSDRYAIVVIFIGAALMTPPDVVSQLLMAVPLMGLYGLSIGICFWITKRREAKLARQAAESGQ